MGIYRGGGGGMVKFGGYEDEMLNEDLTSLRADHHFDRLVSEDHWRLAFVVDTEAIAGMVVVLLLMLLPFRTRSLAFNISKRRRKKKVLNKNRSLDSRHGLSQVQSSSSWGRSDSSMLVVNVF